MLSHGTGTDATLADDVGHRRRKSSRGGIPLDSTVQFAFEERELPTTTVAGAAVTGEYLPRRHFHPLSFSLVGGSEARVESREIFE